MSNSDWLDIDVLDNYLEGKLDSITMHKVERVSLEDPFVAQALAGLMEAKSRTYTLSTLQKKLKERIAHKPVERKRMHIGSHRLSIAAAAAVLFITVGILFWMKEANLREQAQIVAGKASNVEVKIQPEVVPAAAATANSREVLAEPVGGWETYQIYLKDNNKLKVEGDQSVELSFVVLKIGVVADIKVLNGQTDAMNAEAIRLLKEGPKWSFDPQLSNKGTVMIKF